MTNKTLVFLLGAVASLGVAACSDGGSEGDSVTVSDATWRASDRSADALRPGAVNGPVR
jgi:hypothetical protein